MRPKNNRRPLPTTNVLLDHSIREFNTSVWKLYGIIKENTSPSSCWVSKYIQKEDQHLQKENQQNGRKPAQEFQNPHKFWAGFGRLLGDFLGGRVSAQAHL